MEWYNTILLGFGTVFVGLIVLIYIVKLMSAIVASSEHKKPAEAVAAAPVAAAAQETIPDRGAFMAAVASAIATVMGKEVSVLRIL